MTEMAAPPAYRYGARVKADRAGADRVIPPHSADLPGIGSSTARSAGDPPDRSDAAVPAQPSGAGDSGARAAAPARAADREMGQPSKKRCRQRQSPEETGGGAHWVDSDQRCGQCYRVVTGEHRALLCDNDTCEGWLVCEACVSRSGMSLTEGQLAPLLCPKHQFETYVQEQELKAGIERALDHKPDTIGRFLGCLTAFTQGMPMSRVLALAPVSEPDQSIPSLLREDAHKAGDASWDQPRRDRLRNPAFKLLWLASKLAALDVNVRHLRLLAEAYCRHRLSNDRPPGWHKTGAKHVASELSAISQAVDDLSLPYHPYMGAKRCLESRGAFAPREHSPKLPLIPAQIFQMVDSISRPMTPAVQRAADALEWNAFWGLRPLYLEGVTKEMFTPHLGGFLLKWQKATKTKRGDKLAGPDAKLAIPQISAARHERLTRIYNTMPDGGAPPFKGYRAEATKMIRRWFPEQDGFVLCISAQRNGVDMAMLGLGVPDEYVDAHLWWARNVMRGYYGGLQTAVTMHATSLFEKVNIKPIAPGWYDKISMPPRVDWSALPPIDEATLKALAPATFIDVPELPGEAIGPPPMEAPPGVPQRKGRVRNPTAVDVKA